ncbi:MAG: ligase-associated DNA damage response exonuclease [Bacteroidia bacterium]|nr:ligase-associated DNA damage response exonuclease [Bacteroidia bacterium]MCX7763827.1 ligase-associated DNA damage response exonuclease [Bacteroidia bacterium]MDW8056661.1 ligase-associated DNA damage response exonuclease [Bacteroidia bacterium]
MERWIYPTPYGLYCEPGDFFIDPWRPVKYALITHAHSDHARWGSAAYLTSEENVPLLRQRLGNIQVEGLRWGEKRSITGVKVSFHPSGHIRGAAQIRLEYRGEVYVITGDYKRQADPTTSPFEPLKAHVLISECTFGLPIYQWAPPETVIEEIAQWWADCRAKGKNAILYAYSLGKAQRLLASLPPVGPVYVHQSLVELNQIYEAAGVRLLPWKSAAEWNKENGILLIAPPAVQKSRWLSRFEPYEEAQASGWMAIRGRRRQKALDRGFSLSDHADFYQLLQTLRETEAEEVIFTHGYTENMVHLARLAGYNASAWETAYTGEEEIPTSQEAAAEEESLPPTS